MNGCWRRWQGCYGWERGPLRVRGYSQEFRPALAATLALQLRALLGINVRCEIVMYLLTHDAAHPSQIAREAYYFERAVQGTLADMSRSGVVQLRTASREKHYWIKPDQWLQLLNRGAQTAPKWIAWPPGSVPWSKSGGGCAIRNCTTWNHGCRLRRFVNSWPQYVPPSNGQASTGLSR
ncbi:MAG: hypothetical protein NT167_27775, partial [Verrucomicrobia bacterium]|nr:hypothetical protein [Verrucomicrobiota bacterium]